MQHEGSQEGQPKKPVNTNPDSLEYMQKQIEAENKYCVPLPENIEEGDKMPDAFVKLLNKKINPENIILFSAETGLLRHFLADQKGDFALQIYQGDSYLLHIISHKNLGGAYILEIKKPAKAKDELETGPFRKMDYIPPEPRDEEIAVREMQAEIADERALGVEVPKDIQEGDVLPFFAETCKATYPKDIILWSLATGLLRYSGEEDEVWSPAISYTYSNINNPDVKIIVKLPKKETSAKLLFKKKISPATIDKISTLADIENKENKSAEKKEQQLVTLLNKLNAIIQSLEKIIKAGIGDKPMEIYQAELNDTKTAVERALFIVNEEIDKNKK